jgi:hypothetical protein
MQNAEINSRRLHFSGWLSKKYYEFYDSFEIIKTESEVIEKGSDFPLIRAVLKPALGTPSQTPKKTRLGTLKLKIEHILNKLTSPIDKTTKKIIDKFNK